MALNRSRWRISIVVLGLLMMLAYAPVLSAGWSHEDVPPQFSGEFSAVPRGWTAWTIQMQGEQSPSRLHLVNIAIHLANGLLLSTVLPQTAIGAAALGLFWLHPVNSEAVSYIAARADLWLGTAVLLMVVMLTCVRSKQRAFVWATLLLGAAVLAKETGIVAIGFAVLWCATLPRAIPWRWVTACVLVGIGFGWYFVSRISTWTAQPLETWRFLEVQSAAIWRLVLLLIPFGLTVDHDWTHVPSLIGMACFLGLIAVGMTAMASRHAAPSLCFAVLWMLFGFAPRLLIPSASLVTEHHTYVPLLGVWLMPAIRRFAV